MEWTVSSQGQEWRLRLPGQFVAGVPLRVELADGRTFVLIWEEGLRSVHVRVADSSLERCFGLRTRRMQKMPGEAVCELDLEVTGPRTQLVRAKVSPLALGESARQSRQQAGNVVVRSPMTGKVLAVLKQAGSTTEAAEAVLVIEAMKMENQIFAPKAGVIESVQVSAGDLVQVGAPLFKIGGPG